MEKNTVPDESKQESAPQQPQQPSAPPPPQPSQPSQPSQQHHQPHQHQRPQRGGFRPRRNRPESDAHQGEGPELTEKVVFINRSAKVVKGGRRFNFSALVVVGDKRGRVGVGLGKAGEVADAIRKGGESARTAMLPVALKDATIPHEVFSHYCGAKVLLRPASPGTGIIAGKTVRAVLESAGIKDILSKSLGSKNAANVVKATLQALLRLRLRESIYGDRGLQIKKVAPPQAPALAQPVSGEAQPAA